MSERMENLGHRETLLVQRKRLVMEAESHRESLRAALPLHADIDLLDADRIMELGIALSEKLRELGGLNRKLAILNRELGL